MRPIIRRPRQRRVRKTRGVIPVAAIEAYRERPRDDHRWLKMLASSREGGQQVVARLADLLPPPLLHSSMRISQKVCLLLGIAHPQFAFWCDMGFGKTLLALSLIRYWYDAGKLEKALVLVTSDKAFPTWVRQMKEYDIGLPIHTLEGRSVDKWVQLSKVERGVVLVTYPGLLRMVALKVKKKGKPGGELKINLELVDELGAQFGAVVWDESTRLGHRSSLWHHLAKCLARRIDIRYVLAGRPFGRDPTMLWAQQYLVDLGDTFGANVGLFRAAFFNAEKNAYAKSEYAMDYTFDRSWSDRINEIMQHRSITYRTDEVTELPKVTPILEQLKLPLEAGVYYESVKNGIIAAKGNFRAMKNAFLRMRQLSSGFLGLKNDETGEKAEVAFKDNPKLDRLIDLLLSLPSDRQAVVFYEFTHSGRTIHKLLNEEGVSNIWLWSGTKDASGDLNGFADGKSQVAVVNNRVGAYSLDELKAANYMMFYESPVSPIDREQAERRLRRPGQKHKIFMYDLVVRNTMDQRILDFHEEGANLFDSLMRDPEKLMFED